MKDSCYFVVDCLLEFSHKFLFSGFVYKFRQIGNSRLPTIGTNNVYSRWSFRPITISFSFFFLFFFGRFRVISAQTISARTIGPTFQSETARSTLLGPLGPFFPHLFFLQLIVLFCLCASKQKIALIFRQGNRQII